MERYNPWWLREPDTAYERWAASPVRWVPAIVDDAPLRPFSLNFISGPRQVGKTTALRILIHRLLEKREPRSLFFYSCDELTDFRELGELVDNYLSARKSWGIKSSVLFLDEITFVQEWWRAIKARIDSGALAKDVLFVTGSASIDLLKQKELFPGRRGSGRDLVMRPLGFSAYANIRGGLDLRSGGIFGITRNMDANRPFSDSLLALFREFLGAGGFPRAVLDIAMHRKITAETSRAYLDWLRGDWARAGRSDKHMKEVISYLFLARGTPVSWHSIASHSGLGSPHTASAYVETLEQIFSAHILELLTPQSRVDSRKNRKIHFADPLIFKVLAEYTNSEVPDDWLLEATVAGHLSRLGPVHYWRNHTEVDAVCIHNGRQVGFEVTTGVKKWRPPWHIRKAHLVDRTNAHLYLSALSGEKVVLVK